MRLPRIVSILGLPGAGKTRLALELAAQLSARDDSVLVVHTDVLKVTGRQLEGAPCGPGHRGAVDDKARWMERLLDAQAAKAERDGYSLVVEGTMAVLFDRPGVVRVVLEIDERTRMLRCERKYPIAARSLHGNDLGDYRELLRRTTQNVQLRLQAELSPSTLASRCIAFLDDPTPPGASGGGPGGPGRPGPRVVWPQGGPDPE